jgi:Leucine-rich repeat (LRR) protein
MPWDDVTVFFSLNTLSQMTALILANNSLSGTFPSFLQGCTQLGLLDLSGNNFTYLDRGLDGIAISQAKQ